MSETDPSIDAGRSTDEKILYTTKSAGRIVYITINNPARHNVMERAMITRFLEMLHAADQERKAKVLVINSTGDRTFCAGIDLAIFKGTQGVSMEELRSSLLAQLRDISQTIFYMKKPVVMQIQGSAVGLGCFMALAADFRIAARKEGFFFQLPELQLNMPGVTGSTVNSIAALGMARSKRMMLTSDKIGLEELDRWGAITNICEPADLDVEVKKFCLNLVEKNPLLLYTQKMMCNIMGMKMSRLFYEMEDEVAKYAFANWGSERPADLDEFMRRIWSKYGNNPSF